MAIYHLTRSTQLVSLLNGFGHGVSANQLLEIDTALAQHELDRSGEVVLPANINKNVSAVFCFDNFDLCKETRTGANTTHCTNGIVIQRLLAAPSQSVFQVGDYERQTRGHKRSVTAPVASETQPYFAISHFGSPRLTADMTLLQHAEIADCVKTASAVDFMCLALRLPSDVSPVFGTGECLRVPSWAPFNSIYHREHPCQQSVIGYCPVTTLYTHRHCNSPQCTTIYCCYGKIVTTARRCFRSSYLCQGSGNSMEKSATLSNVVAHVGGFHTSMTLLAIVCKRFGDAGLRQCAK